MITFIAISLLIQTFVCFKLYKSHLFHPILTASIIFHTVLWYATPGFITLLIYSGLDDFYSSDNITDDYIALYSLESAIFLCAIVVGKRLIKSKVVKTRQQYPDKLTPRFSMVLILGYITLIISNHFLYGGMTYQESNAAGLYDENRSFAFISVGYSLFLAAVIYVAVTVKNNYLVFSLSIFSLLADVSLNALGGSRIAFALLFFVFFVRTFSATKRLKVRKAWVIAITLVLVFTVVLPLSDTIGKSRSGESIEYANVVNESEFGINLSRTMINLFTKFNSISTGLELIDGYGAGSAGFTPYIGSALIFLPRAIFPGRPMAGSIDGTLYGTPARLVPRLYSEVSDASNVGVSPLAISVWQWGWFFGSILLLLSGILNLYILNYFLSGNNFIHHLLAIYTVSIPTFVGIFSSPDVFLKNLVFLYVAIVAMTLAKRILRVTSSRLD